MNVIAKAVIAGMMLVAGVAALPGLLGARALNGSTAGLTVTRADDGGTIRLRVGDRFLLKLGNDLVWDVTVADQSVVQRVPNIAVVVGAQAVYEALAPGLTELSASGTLPCEAGQFCAAVVELFRLTIFVEPPGGLPYTTAAPMLGRDGPLDAVAVTGRVLAGPVCPVERIPPDPACADRPVGGAVLHFIDSLGHTAGQAVSDSEGAFTVLLPPGRYRLVPQPVAGLLGTAPPQDVTVTADGTPLVVTYDTGIR